MRNKMFSMKTLHAANEYRKSETDFMTLDKLEVSSFNI